MRGVVTAVVIEPSGLCRAVAWDVTVYQHLHEAVGGYIEVAPLAHELDAVVLVNEEGALDGLPPNTAASILTGAPIAGPAVVTGPMNAAGDLTPINAKVLARLKDVARSAELWREPDAQ